MKRNDRERLVEMVRGKSSRQVRIYGFRFGDDPTPDILVDEEEVDKLTPEGQDNLVLFGCRPEDRERTLRENACLVRQEDGRFVAVNPEREGLRFLIL